MPKARVTAAATLPPPQQAPLRKPFAFDRRPDHCSACVQERDAPLVTCLECEARVHVGCYPRATSKRSWLCDLCSVQLQESQCALCEQTSERGILQAISLDEYKRMDAQKARALAASHGAAPMLFAHAFCLALWKSADGSATLARAAECRVCHKRGARATCEVCPTAVHPFCALQRPGLLQHTPSGQITVWCADHAQRAQVATPTLQSNAAASAPAAGPLPVPLQRPPPPAAVLARPPPPLPTIVAAAAPAAAAKPQRVPIPVIDRNSGTSAPAAAAATASAAAAAASASSHSAAASSVPAKPAAVSSRQAPVANDKAASNGSRAAAASDEPPLSAKANFLSEIMPHLSRTKSNGSSTSRAATPQRRIEAVSDDEMEDAAPARAPAASIPASASASAAAASKVSAKSSSAATQSEVTRKPAAAAAGADERAPAKSSKAAAAAAAASPAKAAKSSSSSSSSAAAAGRVKQFSSHPDRAASYVPDASDEDEGEYEPVALPIRSEQTERAKKNAALADIKEQREAQYEAPQDCCAVCGDDWEIGPSDDEADEEDETYDTEEWDKMVGCEGCDHFYHQSCYGIRRVPKGDYYCWPCKRKRKPKEVVCVICNSTAWRGFCEVEYVKDQTRPDVWKDSRKHKHFAHINCVLWHPEPYFKDAEWRNPARDIELIPRGAYSLRCSDCSRTGGACLQCMNGDCTMAFHVLCMLAKPNEFYNNTHEEDEDVWDEKSQSLIRPVKEYYCRGCSKRKFLEVKRAELAASGASKQELEAMDDRILAATPQVVPTKELLPPSKLVGVVPPKQGRGKRRVIEVDPTDQEERQKAGEEAREKVKVKRERDAESEDGSSVAAGSKRASSTRRSSIDDDVETIESSDGEDEHKPKRRKLRKNAELNLVQSPAAPAASAVDVVSGVTPQIEARSRVRSTLLALPLERELCNAVEAALWSFVGRRASSEYRQRAQDLLFNLQANDDLRAALSSGRLPPEQLVAMDNAAMAGSEAKRRRANASEQRTKEHIAAPHAVLVNKTGQLVALDPSTGQRRPASELDMYTSSIVGDDQ